MTKPALIIVDVQNDFCEGGSLAVTGGAQAAADITEYGDEHFYDYATMVATKCWHERDGHADTGVHWAKPGTDPDYNETWPPHCEAGTAGAEFHPNLDDYGLVDVTFFKGRKTAAYSGFEGSTDISEWQDVSLDEHLRVLNVDEVHVVGIAYDYCVKATALDAARLGYRTVVIKPLTASVTPDNDAAITAELEAAGVQVVEEVA